MVRVRVRMRMRARMQVPMPLLLPVMAMILLTYPLLRRRTIPICKKRFSGTATVVN